MLTGIVLGVLATWLVVLTVLCWETRVKLWHLEQHPTGAALAFRDTADVPISLDQQEFRTLIRGGVVRRGEVRIAMSDIGYIAMSSELDEAMGGLPNFPARSEEAADGG